MNIAEVKAGLEDMSNRIEALRLSAGKVPDGYLLFVQPKDFKMYYQQRDGRSGFYVGIRDDWSGAPVFELASADGNIASRPDLNIKKQHVGEFILERLRECVAGRVEMEDWLAGLENE